MPAKKKKKELLILKAALCNKGKFQGNKHLHVRNIGGEESGNFCLGQYLIKLPACCFQIQQ